MPPPSTACGYLLLANQSRLRHPLLPSLQSICLKELYNAQCFALSSCPDLEVLHIIKVPECTDAGVTTVADKCRLIPCSCLPTARCRRPKKPSPPSILPRRLPFLPSNYNFEIHKTVHRVVSSATHRVALQLPDGRLMYALPLADILRSSAGAEDVLVLLHSRLSPLSSQPWQPSPMTPPIPSTRSGGETPIRRPPSSSSSTCRSTLPPWPLPSSPPSTAPSPSTAPPASPSSSPIIAAIPPGFVYPLGLQQSLHHCTGALVFLPDPDSSHLLRRRRRLSRLLSPLRQAPISSDPSHRRPPTSIGHLRLHAVAIDADTTLHCWISNSLPISSDSHRDGPSLKPLLVLIHGFGPSTTGQWRYQVRPLSRHFDLVILDLLFFGGSSSLAL